jgi:hypothetical protein
VNGRSANLPRRLRFDFSFVILGFLLLGGCGAPGEPQPPSPPIPSAVNDLAAHQQGHGVQLVFTLPGHTVGGDRLAEPPAIETRGPGRRFARQRSFKLVLIRRAGRFVPRRVKYDSLIRFPPGYARWPVCMYAHIACARVLPKKDSRFDYR